MLEQSQPTMQIPPTGGVHAKVEKGMAGKYGWSLSITLPLEWKPVTAAVAGQLTTNLSARFDECIAALTGADGEMRRTFGGEA